MSIETLPIGELKTKRGICELRARPNDLWSRAMMSREHRRCEYGSEPSGDGNRDAPFPCQLLKAGPACDKGGVS